MAEPRRASVGKTGSDSPSVSTALLDAHGPHSPVSTPGFTPPMAPFARTSRAPSVQSFYTESPYGGPGTRVSSIVDKWSLGPDPRLWGADLSFDVAEDDDELHRPEKDLAVLDRGGGITSARGIGNLGCLLILILGILGLFAGYPIARTLEAKRQQKFGAFNVGGTNATGQVPVIIGSRGLIDPDTPQEAYTKGSWFNKGEFELVFSDEFNTDGRSFYPGDDPYWEAVDLHYWPTGDKEWYDPRAITTSGGSLAITYTQDAEHKFGAYSGMMQSWNKFCFTGGLIEARVMMPGWPQYLGMWPAVWTMGNLGRAGYGSTTDGLWPYSYDECDIGTVKNQTLNGAPIQAYSGNDQYNLGLLSFLPGQRLSRCTCPDDADLHPGPKHPDGTFVGRSAPEIDIFEQQVGLVEKNMGEVSQSVQFAPFNIKYDWQNLTDDSTWGITDPNITKVNSYTGGAFQQAGSYVTKINQDCFEKSGQCYSIYGFEYAPGFDEGYIQWIADNKTSWHITGASMQPDPVAGIGRRPIPQEPLYLIMNLGQSPSFTPNISPDITYPVTMYVDYIRVYQPKGQTNVGCDPKNFPTAKYIAQNIEAYTNPNLTQYGVSSTGGYGFNKTFPRNKFLGEC